MNTTTPFKMKKMKSKIKAVHQYYFLKNTRTEATKTRGSERDTDPTLINGITIEV